MVTRKQPTPDDASAHLPSPNASPEEPRFDSAEYESQVATHALVFVRFFMAHLKRLRGEGHEDARSDEFLEKLFALASRYMKREVALATLWWIKASKDDLTAAYWRYKHGEIETREDLLDVVRKYFSTWPEALAKIDVFAPDRVTLARMGPAAYAEFALGQALPKKVGGRQLAHQLASFGRLYSEGNSPFRPYGLSIDADEIVAFIRKHFEGTERGMAAKLRLAMNDAMRQAICDADANRRKRPSMANSRARDAVGRERTEAADARAKVASNRRPGPGRPPKHAKR